MKTIACEQCHKPVVAASDDSEIKVFCDNVCLNSYNIETTSESKEEMLAAIGYAENRSNYLDNQLEEEF